MSFSFTLSEKEREVLVKLLRWSINSGLEGVDVPKHLLEDVHYDNLCVPRGCFVTLRLNEELRGCIGTILPLEPLYKNIIHMAYAAAFSDPRFSPLSKEEWPRVSCEISVLGPISRCPDPGLIQIGRHGLLLQKNSHSGVFLPSVPAESGWSLLEYLDNLCLKAGLPKGTWRESGVQLCWFEAYVFTV